MLSALEQFAPLPLQEDWDNAGLQIGLTEAEVSGALLCLDVTEAVVTEAVDRQCNLIVSHHPLLFRGLKRISGSSDVERAVMKAISHGIAIISMHTNMDNAWGGVNCKIAEKIGLQQVHLFACKQLCIVQGGSGVTGLLPQPMDAEAFIAHVKRIFSVECAQCNELLKRPIQRVALCGGAGDFLLEQAIAAGADAFITGEMHYHVYAGHEQQVQICVIGHYQSEQYTVELFREILNRQCPEMPVHLSKSNVNPILYKSHG